MPVIQAKVSVKLTDEQKTQIERGCGEAITAFSGKSEAVLMVCVEDVLSICFAGDNQQPAAYYSVQIKGDSPREEYQDFISSVIALNEQVTGIPANRTFVSIDPVPYWGAFGNLLP